MRTHLLTIGIVTAVLAACFGAVKLRGNQQAEAEPQTEQEPGPVRTRGYTDKRIRLPLEVVRAPEGVGERAFARVETIVGFGPRYSAKPVGMPGWTKQLSYIEAELQKHGLTVERDTWTDRKELITFTNLSATIPGERSERILIGCHHDTKCTVGHPDRRHNFDFVGANDGASAVALLLELAPVLAAHERQATIELVFFDGEESLDWSWNDAKRALFGSKRYVERHRDAELIGEESRITAVILLDMVSRKDLHIQDELYSTPRLRTILWSAAVACGHEKHFFRRAEGAADDHVPFMEVGIPAVDLIDLNGNPYWHTPMDTIDNMSPGSLQIVADVVLTMLPEVEREYVLKRD